MPIIYVIDQIIESCVEKGEYEKAKAITLHAILKELRVIRGCLEKEESET
jgi:hypothetical protein